MILILIGLAIAFVGVITIANCYTNRMFVVGLTVALTGATLFIAGVAQDIKRVNAYNEETVRICSAKDGVVSEDDLCIVNNKPVEFMPGVWRR